MSAWWPPSRAGRPGWERCWSGSVCGGRQLSFPRVPYQRFAAHLIASLAERFPGFGKRSTAALQSKTSAGVIDRVVTTLVNEVYEHLCEPALDPGRPIFVTDYPSAISPLTRPRRDNPDLCERWELLIGGMELGTAYTELNNIVALINRGRIHSFVIKPWD